MPTFVPLLVFCLGSGIGSVVCDGVTKKVVTAAITTAAIAIIASSRSLYMTNTESIKHYYAMLLN
jgi:hypothetical protein